MITDDELAEWRRLTDEVRGMEINFEASGDVDGLYQVLKVTNVMINAIPTLLDENADLRRQLEQAQTDAAKCREAQADLVAILVDMVNQHCPPNERGELDSMAISTNASAMHLLAEHGRLEILRESGRRVIARYVKAQKGDVLSPKMRAAVEHMKRHNNKMVRFPGGYWAAVGWSIWSGPSFGTPTIEALVRRGVAEYTAWKDGRGGKFPIECTLKTEAQP